MNKVFAILTLVAATLRSSDAAKVSGMYMCTDAARAMVYYSGTKATCAVGGTNTLLTNGESGTSGFTVVAGWPKAGVQCYVVNGQTISMKYTITGTTWVATRHDSVDCTGAVSGFDQKRAGTCGKCADQSCVMGDCVPAKVSAGSVKMAVLMTCMTGGADPKYFPNDDCSTGGTSLSDSKIGLSGKMGPCQIVGTASVTVSCNKVLASGWTAAYYTDTKCSKGKHTVFGMNGNCGRGSKASVVNTATSSAPVGLLAVASVAFAMLQ